MIKFKDFVPEIKVKGSFLRAHQFGNLTETVQAANNWLNQQNVEMLNIETVVLPNMHDSGEEGSDDPALTTNQYGGSWHQFIRVWYR